MSDEKTYADFEIWILPPPVPPVPGQPSLYPTLVTTSPEGPASGLLKLDIEESDFKKLLVRARGEEPTPEVRQQLGQQLFQALVSGQVLIRWVGSVSRVKMGLASGLRVRLVFQVPHLGSLPWELIYDPDQGFLAAAGDQVVARYLPVTEPAYFLSREKLRVLLVVESPDDPLLKPILPDEINTFQNTIKSVGNLGEFKLLQNAPLEQLQLELQNDYHVLHYLGHGMENTLILTEKDGHSRDDVTSDAFADLFQGRLQPRLVVLTACSSAGNAEGIFAGVGPALVQRGRPAVIAMQYPFVSLDTAKAFSEQFYGSLAQGVAVDIAVNEARNLLHSRFPDDRDWSTPVLYLGTRTGRILTFAQGAAGEVQRVVQEAAHASEQTAAAMKALSTQVEAVAFRAGRINEWLDFASRVREVANDIENLFDKNQKAKKAPVDLVQDLAEDVQWYWDKVCQKSIRELRLLRGAMVTIARGDPTGDEGAPTLPIEAWFDEIDALLGKVKGAIENSLDTTAGDPVEIKKTVGEIDVQIRSLRDLLSAHSGKGQERLKNETVYLGKLTQALKSQVKI
jgi:hypothetical protein